MVLMPDPKSIPGMSELLGTLDPNISILGNEPHADFEMKLFTYDNKIGACVENGNLEAMGRLIEMREAIIEERFVLTEKYLTDKKAIIDELEPQEQAAFKANQEVTLRRLRFEKYRRIFRTQEQFLARNYPVKFFVKEKLKGWERHGAIVSSSK